MIRVAEATAFALTLASSSARREERFQALLPLDQRTAREPFAIQAKKIECEVDQRSPQTPFRSLTAEGVLQQLKAGAAVGQDDGDLTVDERVLDR